MEGISGAQVLLAVIAVLPGLAALLIQWRKQQQDTAAGRMDDQRDDYLARFEAADKVSNAAGQVSTVAMALLRQAGERIGELEKQVKEFAEKQDAMEVSIHELQKSNLALAQENHRLRIRVESLKAELQRMADEQLERPDEP